MDLDAIIRQKSQLIDSEIEKVFPKNGIPNLHDAVWYHLGTGGKRLRPILAIMTCEALGGDANKVLPFAAACEIFHSWCLIHDDIVDGDRVRRGQPAVWVRHGLAHGINTGDLMAQKVFELVLRSRLYGVPEATVLRLADLMAATGAKTAEGQAMDINFKANDAPTEAEYMRIAEMKTAYYMTAPMIGGAVIAGADDAVTERILAFGRLAGPAFQIADDVLDLTEGKGRRETGRDIKEGKRTLLVVHALAHCTSSEKEQLLRILNTPVEQTSDADVAYVRALYEKHGSIAHAQQRAAELIRASKAVIEPLPPKLREMLDFFGDYLIARKK